MHPQLRIDTLIYDRLKKDRDSEWNILRKALVTMRKEFILTKERNELQVRFLIE